MRAMMSGVTVMAVLAACLVAGVAVGQGPSNDASMRAERKHIAEHYGGSRQGLVALGDGLVLWFMFGLESEEPAYRVLAIDLADFAREDLNRLAHSLPYKGAIHVEPSRHGRGVRVILADGPHRFEAKFGGRSQRGNIQQPEFPLTSIGATTFGRDVLGRYLEEFADLDLELVGKSWPMVLYATGAFQGNFVTSEPGRAPSCCENDLGCITGGKGSLSCSYSAGGQSVGITCGKGFYACCCDFSPVFPPDLVAHCCPNE